MRAKNKVALAEELSKEKRKTTRDATFLPGGYVWPSLSVNSIWKSFLKY